MSYRSIFKALAEGEKVPRKAKKLMLGKKIPKSRIKDMLKKVEVLYFAKTMWENPVISPHIFCPKCGCIHDYGTGNMADYPEHWEHFKCLRCGYLVGMIDNSPFQHVLELAPEFSF